MFKIIEATNDKDYEICDKLFEELLNFDNNLDLTINSNVKINGMHKQINTYDKVFSIYAINENNTPIAFAHAYLKILKNKVRNTNVVELESLYVKKEYRNKNIGKSLIENIEKWANKNFGTDYIIEITCFNNNANALDFYKHLGYKEIKTILRK